MERIQRIGRGITTSDGLYVGFPNHGDPDKTPLDADGPAIFIGICKHDEDEDIIKNIGSVGVIPSSTGYDFISVHSREDGQLVNATGKKANRLRQAADDLMKQVATWADLTEMASRNDERREQFRASRASDTSEKVANI